MGPARRIGKRVIMFTALVLAFLVIPMFCGLMKLVMRLLGWTLSVVMSILFLPLCLIGLVVGGIALLAEALIPFMLIVFVLSLIVPDSDRGI